MRGRLATVTSPFTTRLTTKTSQTAAHGSVNANAPTANTRLSIGTATPLLTSTLAHWWRVVTLVTNQWYTSVSASSLTTSATIDATVMRHTGPSTAEYCAP